MKQKTPHRLADLTEESIDRIASTGDVSALASALRVLRHEERYRHAAHMAAEYADRPRYAISDDWSHYFSDVVPEFDTRWVFDRRRWGVAVLHVKRESHMVWFEALPDEIADLDESLVHANASALDVEMGDYGVREADELPGWVSEATKIERATFVETLP